MDNKILGKFTTSTVKLLSNARSPHCQKTHTEKNRVEMAALTAIRIIIGT